jgi:hypothetical protein
MRPGGIRMTVHLPVPTGDALDRGGLISPHLIISMCFRQYTLTPDGLPHIDQRHG